MRIDRAAPTTVTAPADLTRLLYWIGLLLLCSAFLQGGLVKAFDFPSAIAEMQHFGMAPATPLAFLVIVGEIGSSLMILTGVLRWFGAAYLCLFTLATTFIASRFWEMSGAVRFSAENTFFEHLGLVGAFLLVAVYDWRARAA